MIVLLVSRWSCDVCYGLLNKHYYFTMLERPVMSWPRTASPLMVGSPHNVWPYSQGICAPVLYSHKSVCSPDNFGSICFHICVKALQYLSQWLWSDDRDLDFDVKLWFSFFDPFWNVIIYAILIINYNYHFSNSNIKIFKTRLLILYYWIKGSKVNKILRLANIYSVTQTLLNSMTAQNAYEVTQELLNIMSMHTTFTQLPRRYRIAWLYKKWGSVS